MNEIEKLDLIIDHLVSTRSRMGHNDLNRDLNFKITSDEAKYLFNKLIEDGVVDILRTPINELVGIKYSHVTQKFYDQGGYAKHNELIKAKEAEEEKLKTIEDEKLISEAKLAKWQVNTFWWFFFLAVIGGICGIISLVMQLT
jgi:hypothetical protein